MKPTTFRRLMNLWPPFLFNGIRILHIHPDWSEVRVVLKLRPWNRNYVRTQFGGNLFSMTDPFWMLMAMHRLGPDYIVWDQAGSIEFIAPGREHVFAHFVLDDDAIDELRQAAAGGEKVLRWYAVDIKTRSGELIARVQKQLYVRLKKRLREQPQKQK